jgi:hypothetical protein
VTTGRAVHRAEDGTETDITEGVQALYDLVISSMNWGSGFWTGEDALPVAVVGRLLGFEKIDEVERYVNARSDYERAEPWRFRNEQSITAVPHEHVLNSAGRCVWPWCGHAEYVENPAPAPQA